ncbi:hypothetical protein [Nostoc piscinale]|nr:hypothetical protein [Nostoc piscinale]
MRLRINSGAGISICNKTPVYLDIQQLQGGWGEVHGTHIKTFLRSLPELAQVESRYTLP